MTQDELLDVELDTVIATARTHTRCVRENQEGAKTLGIFNALTEHRERIERYASTLAQNKLVLAAAPQLARALEDLLASSWSLFGKDGATYESCNHGIHDHPKSMDRIDAKGRSQDCALCNARTALDAAGISFSR